ncbi:DNA primase [Dactylosporangium sp. NPDC005555]|uniref:DNA primase n=1 Tax=Dactylosporangium sp. NPDC005555 TaxID=3154889 RepID=UPI0033B97DC2
MARQSSRPSSSRPASSRPAAAKKSTPAAAEPASVEEPLDEAPEAPEIPDTTATADVVEDVDAVEDDEVEDALDDDADLDEEDNRKERSAQADAMWSDVNVEPVEIALRTGVGYTLRAYRLSTELTPTELDEEEDDFAILHRREADADEDEVVILDEHAELFADEEPAVSTAKPAKPAKKSRDSDDDDSEADDADAVDLNKSDDADDDTDKADDAEADEEAEADVIADDEEEDEEEPEEVPAFLSHRGKLLVFRSAEGLVEFVKSDAEHDLRQLDTWDSLKTRITASSVAPKDEDRYELDLVVENLRGGQDAWDADLLISAGEVARDLAHALRLEPVRTALAADSPLDDLDEALRAAVGGGVGGFFAKRRLKKIGAQQAALGWRTIIGKISAAVDWRD